MPNSPSVFPPGVGILRPEVTDAVEALTQPEAQPEAQPADHTEPPEHVTETEAPSESSRDGYPFT